jgi:hypothetical protein
MEARLLHAGNMDEVGGLFCTLGRQQQQHTWVGLACLGRHQQQHTSSRHGQLSSGVAV